MPSVSGAQNRFMHSVAEGRVPSVPEQVGADFVAADKGRKISALPEHVTPAHRLKKALSGFRKRI